MTKHILRPKTLVLGSGTSTGVPLIGCKCPVCKSDDPKDCRMRSSIYITYDDYSILVDTAPDLRSQALKFDLQRVNSLLITHNHADHVYGMDDIRQFNRLQNSYITAYAADFTMKALQNMFSYIFDIPESQKNLYRPHIKFVALDYNPIELGPFVVTPFVVPHGPESSLGYRFNCQDSNFVYVPDCSEVTPEMEKMMSGANAIMLDGLRARPHASHITFAAAADTMKKIGSTISYITHIGHDFFHSDIIAMLPEGVEPAYDGMEFFW